MTWFGRSRRRIVGSGLAAVIVGVGLTTDARAQPLANAAKQADWEAVRELLQQGADVMDAQGDGTTALHWASYWDAGDIADPLIRAGADVNATNDLGVTPLWTACEQGSAVMVRRLLQAGADPDAALPSGETLIMTAARSGNADVVRQLADGGADVDARGARGQTALMWAVAQRHADVVEVLLANDAKVHLRADVRTEVVKTSPEPWNPDYILELQQGGYTPLLFAARVGDLASAKLLVARGADVDDIAPYGTSATLVAAHSGRGDVAAFLVERGADPNAADAGYTALHAAILHKDEDLVETLLIHGADPNAPVLTSTPVRRDSIDFYLHPSYVGATPFWLAARFGAPAVMRLLVEHGADPLFVHQPTYWEGSLSVREDRAQVFEGDTTALMAAAGMGGRSPLVAVDRLNRIAESAPVRSTRREPDPAVVEAATLEAVTIALEHGVDLHRTNADGDTALHAAAARGHDSVVVYLVEHGARLDVRNVNGRTPLDRATESRRGDSTVELLRRLAAR
jgi:ankyrin repeat protein